MGDQDLRHLVSPQIYNRTILCGLKLIRAKPLLKYYWGFLIPHDAAAVPAAAAAAPAAAAAVPVATYNVPAGPADAPVASDVL